MSWEGNSNKRVTREYTRVGYALGKGWVDCALFSETRGDRTYGTYGKEKHNLGKKRTEEQLGNVFSRINPIFGMVRERKQMEKDCKKVENLDGSHGHWPRPRTGMSL